MATFYKIIELLLGVGAGTAIIKYSFNLARLFGQNYYAEKYLGSGGTYSMWKIIGVVVIVATLWYVFSSGV